MVEGDAAMPSGRAPRQRTRTQIYLRLVGLIERKWLLLPMMLVGYTMVSAGNVGFADWLRTVTGELTSEASTDALSVSLLLVGFLVLRGVGTLLGTYSNQRIGARLAHRLRVLIFDRLLHSRMEYFDRSAQGEDVTRITYMAMNASSGISQIGLVGIRDSLQVIGLLGYLFYLNWQITLYLFVAVPVLAMLFIGASGRIRKLAKNTQAGLGQIVQAVNETISGVAVVKIFQAEKREAEVLNKQSRQLMHFFIKMGLVQGFLIPLVQILAGVVIAGISYMALAGHVGSLDGQTFVAYFVAVGMLFTPLRQISQIHLQLEICAVAAGGIFEFLDSEGEEAEVGQPLPAGDVPDDVPDIERGDVVARNLSFTYPDGTRALRDVSFHLEPGTITALVGHSGSGKTTITSLLCGFYLGWEGSFQLAGREISQLGLLSLRRQIALVNQQVMLFSGTIAENIAYGKPDTSREDIEQAARNADAWEFISELRQGLDTFVGPGGAQLSGGQKQRLSIARAFLCDSPIVILDEATASLDNLSERRIQRVLRRLVEGRIVLIVSHRLQFVREADNILVLDSGRLVESGKHDALIEQGGHYAALYEHKPRSPSATAQEPAPLPQVTYDAGLIPMQPSETYSSKPDVLASAWYKRRRWLWALAVLSLPLLVIWAVRWLLYYLRLRRPVSVPVPVVVVGNVTAGGTGKTPLVGWLAEQLKRRGLRVGIVSRGYGGKSPWYPLFVDEDTSVEDAGDEAWMLRRNLGCPVAVGPDRVAAAALLLEHADCDLLLADDGLQHLRLGRDVEIVVLDGTRRMGNGLMYPAGPLREPSSYRLRRALFAVVKDKFWKDLPCSSYVMNIRPEYFVHLDSEQRVATDAWPLMKRVHACVALGNPDSFFNLLRSMGFEVIEHAFPDHYQFDIADLSFADSLPVLMSEKDAVKCRGLSIRNAWYLKTEPDIPGGDAMVDLLLSRLPVKARPSSADHWPADEAALAASSETS